MGLENADFISQLVESNPVGAVDTLGDADNHLRLLKHVLRNQFPNLGEEQVTVSASELNGGGMPTGSLIDFAGTVAPSGYLLCDGGAVSRTTYADLFAVIGTTWGAGDGSTTFNLPDFRGRIIAGLDNMGGASADIITDPAADAVAGTMGVESQVLTEANIPDITISIGGGSHQHEIIGGSANINGAFSLSSSTQDRTLFTKNDGSHSHSASTPNTQGTAHNNVQPTAFCLKVIKT